MSLSRRTFLGGCVITVAAAAGCYTGGSVSNRDDGRDGTKDTVTSTSATETAAIVGLPCDVAAILAASCAGCHGTKLTGGAPNRLMSHEDLMATSITDGKTSVAELTLSRIKSKSPKLMMPPAGSLTASEIKVFEAWLAAGAPRGECSDATVANPIYDTPTVCSSNTHWTNGDRGSALMRPGGACIACHDKEVDAPSYVAAGTVYSTAHEPDDCNGIDSSEPTKVVITDAKGKTYTMTVNSVGNFFFDTRAFPIEVPLRAKVVRGSKTREMKDPAMHGDCNKCHTETGLEKAPGRVMAP